MTDDQLKVIDNIGRGNEAQVGRILSELQFDTIMTRWHAKDDNAVWYAYLDRQIEMTRRNFP